VAALAAGLFLLPACGASGSAGTLSCDLSAKGSYCQDFTATESETNATCKSAGGVFASAACPTANRVGSCANALVTVRYYATGPTPWSIATAQTNCSGVGSTFTPN
jgi:hypothetical protein